MATCKLCERNPAEVKDMCDPCMATLGIIEMPPPRRRAAPCVKCNGLRFVRVIPREHTTVPGIDHNMPQLAPLTLTQDPRIEPKLFGKGKHVMAPRVVLGHGMLETYTCLACGYVEWYVEDPTEIPIGPEYMSELVDYTPGSAYR